LNADILIGRERGIRGCGHRCQPRAQTLHEGLALNRSPDLRAILGHVPFVLLPGHQLLAIVTERLAARNTQVAGLEVEQDLRAETQLKILAVDFSYHLSSFGFARDKVPPLLWYPGEIQTTTPVQPRSFDVAILPDEGNRLLQRSIWARVT